MNLDFGTLFDKVNIVEVEPKEYESSRDLIAETSAERRAKEIQRARDIIKSSIESANKNNGLKKEIIDGLESGEPIENLFLKAIEIIGNAEPNTVFYNQAKSDYINIYGHAFKHEAPLRDELKEVEERLYNLRKSEKESETDEERRSIQRAIKRHEEKVHHIKSMINN